jgi:hypothetical protein
VPETHVFVPEPQGLPGVPQLVGSVIRLMQPLGEQGGGPVHAVNPGRQAQLPEKHACSSAHTLPGLPQLSGSEVRSRQLAATHTAPGPHAMPQPPQLFGSVFVSTQTPLAQQPPLHG